MDNFECLVYEILFIKERNLSLNMQNGSIRAKLFVKGTFHYLLPFQYLNIFYLSLLDWIMTLAKRRNLVNKFLICFYEMFYRNFFIVKCF